MVADAGCDPTGDRPCDAAFERVVGDDTALTFPSGTYRFDEQHVVMGATNLGIVGLGDVTFEAPAGFNDHWFLIDRGRDLLFENVTLDVTAPNAAPTLQLGVTDGLQVRNVTTVGWGIVDEYGPVGDALLPVVRSPSGRGVVENFVATTGGRIGTYNEGDGRTGIYIGRSCEGTIRLVNCHLEEFPNNGIYASQTHATVQIVGGVFRNNDISQVRLGGNQSYVEGATIEIDRGAVRPPNRPTDYLRTRGVRIEGGDLPIAGVTVRDTDIWLKDANDAGVAVGKAGGTFRIANTRIRTDADGAPAIRAKTPDGGVFDPPPRPHGGVIESVTITGRAAKRSAIEIFDRPQNHIADVSIRQPGSRRDGVRLVRSPGTTIDGGEFATAGYPIVLVGPFDAAADDCLVTVRPPLGLATDVDLSDATTLAGRGDGTSAEYCVAQVETATDASTPVIAITDIGDGAVTGARIPPRSVEW